jgi:hypothetical protein
MLWFRTPEISAMALFGPYKLGSVGAPKGLDPKLARLPLPEKMFGTERVRVTLPI